MNATNLRRMGNHEILTLFADIIEELGRRGVTRSKNNPVADYAEHLVCKAFSLTPAEKSTKGYDAIDRAGKKYEIKSRRICPANKRRSGLCPTRCACGI